MNLAELLTKRLVLISGKGGVGKTTVALLLALRAAQLKKKTLLVEMNSTERVAPYFGLKEIGHTEMPVAPYLTAINLNPQACFEEYVLQKIHFRKIFDLFINNRFVTSFLNAVPGFNELLMVGRIYEMEKQKKGRLSRTFEYDLIIVDGPATGHGGSAFTIPDVVRRMVRMGPIHKQAARISALLNDAEKTAFSMVTLPAEMPVTEGIELLNSVKVKLGFALGPVFMNRFVSPSFNIKTINSMDEALKPYFQSLRHHQQQIQLSQKYLLELKEKLPGQLVITLPEQAGPLIRKQDFSTLLEVLRNHDSP